MNLPTASGNSWRPCCRPNGLPPVGRVGTIARVSMGSFGSWPRARPGGMCRGGMARGRRCTVASAAGGWPGAGTASSLASRPRPTRLGGWTGRSTSSMPRSSGPTSTRSGQRGGRRLCGFSLSLCIQALAVQPHTVREFADATVGQEQSGGQTDTPHNVLASQECDGLPHPLVCGIASPGIRTQGPLHAVDATGRAADYPCKRIEHPKQLY